MIITRKPLARRTLLRGMGTLLSLPLLEAMIPSANAAEAAARNRKRLQVIYMPNGMDMDNFFPKELGENYVTPPTLKPLEPYRQHFAVVSGLDHAQAEALGDGAGDHGRCCGSYLTGVHVKKTEGADLRSGVSMDQLVAKQFGEQTQIPSMELGLDPPSLVGSCDSGYSCAYTNTLSWADASTPLPVTTNPHDVFERLFGDSDSLDPKGRMAQMRRQASILDFVAEDAKRKGNQKQSYFSSLAKKLGINVVTRYFPEGEPVRDANGNETDQTTGQPTLRVWHNGERTAEQKAKDAEADAVQPQTPAPEATDEFGDELGDL